MIITEQELIEQLEREKLLFDEMLALSERQLLLLGDTEQPEDELVAIFEALIDEREILMGLIDGIQAGIKENAADAAYKELLERYRRELEFTITGIQHNDQQVLKLAGQTLGVFQQKLQAARHNKKALQAYYGEVDTGGKGWFIDRKK